MPRGRPRTSPVSRTTGRQQSATTVNPMTTAEEHVRDLMSAQIRGSVKLGRTDYSAQREFPNEDWTEQDVVLMLDKLSPRQVTYAVARVYGFNISAAAEQVNAGVETVRGWEDEPWWSTLIERERGRGFGGKGGALFHLAPLVVRRLTEEVMGMHGDKFAHEAAIYIADQTWGKATQTNINREESGVDTQALAQELVTEMRAFAAQNRGLFEKDRKALTDADANGSGEDRLVQPVEGGTVVLEDGADR